MPKFAVIDVETTGFYFRTTDRIVEVAVVGVDESCGIEWTWTSLVNPNRDVGPVSIHGIAASDVVVAPAFADVAGHIARLVRGRVPVAHNASFDAHFLQAEFLRCGWDLSEILGYHKFCCTCVLSGRLIPEAGRSLGSLCEHTGIPNEDAHEALSDATATARLLQVLMTRSGGTLPIDVDPALPGAWPDIPVVTTEGLRRGSPAAKPRHYLARLVDGLHPIQVDSGEATAYLGMLDRVLLDRQISFREHQQLTELAEQLGLGRHSALALNQEYLGTLATAAWADGVVTEMERDDLVSVANLLGLDEDSVDAALEGATAATPASCVVDHFALKPGDRVVLTGDMDRSKGEWTELANAVGLRVTGSVSGKTRLCVAADPDTLSNKGKDAQQKGVPIVTEQAFAEMLSSLLRESL